MNLRTLVLSVCLWSIASPASAMPFRRLVEKDFKLPDDIEVKQENFSQTIDHTGQSSYANATFLQRYFYSTSYSTSPDAPVFYIICGESECGGIDIQPTIDLAKKLHANLVALEHRFYGPSQPFPGDHPLANENLKYLTMGQALEDLATFETFMKAKMGWTGKWVSVGGSYSGALSAYYRALYPQMVVGALASSGTVRAIADFYQYDQHVGQALGPQCLAAVQKVVADVESKMKDPTSKAAVKDLFQASDVTNDQDFLYVVGDMLGGIVQYGHKDEFCTALIAAAPVEKDEVYARAAITYYYSRVSVGAFGSYLDDSGKDAQIASMRGWMYESCNEFGFYQTVSHDAATATRSAQITLAYHNQACERMFGIKKQVNVGRTNKVYLSAVTDSKTNQLLMVNGSVDPYSEASLTPTNYDQSANPHLDLFMIPGGSHCSDLGPALFAAIGDAQAKFEELATAWLK